MKRFFLMASGVVTFTAAMIALFAIAVLGGYHIYPVSTLLPFGIVSFIVAACGAGTISRYEK